MVATSLGIRGEPGSRTDQGQIVQKGGGALPGRHSLWRIDPRERVGLGPRLSAKEPHSVQFASW